ncbi:retrovirus-related Pol polyprotein from transposon TNT 1-94 [Trichonephila clavipes]|nr:retrovirus-related Pol polyprotein from transposon TNT 1-94 [Trichonephila clavipes]
MTGQIYRDVILEQHVRFSSGARGAEFLFMDDNARPHRANILDKCFQSEDITREDVGIFISRVKTAATRLQEAGHKLDDLYIGFQLIRWLPQEFQSTVQQIYRWKEEDFRVVKIEAELILEANRLQLMKQDLEKAENAYLSSFTSKSRRRPITWCYGCSSWKSNGKNDYQRKVMTSLYLEKEMENVNFVLQLLQKNFDLKIMGKTKKLLGIEFEEIDSDFATNRDDRVSMGGFITFIDETPISWRTFKQKSVSLSTMEAEYVSLTEAAKEFIWLKNVIDNKSLNLELSENVMFCDNQAAISFSKSPVENYRTKHIDVRYHFLRNLIYDKVQNIDKSVFKWFDKNEFNRVLKFQPNGVRKVKKFKLDLLSEMATDLTAVNDEAHFWLNGYVNKQNCRIWSEANPQVYVETPLHPEQLTVWCALWAGGILHQKR